MKSSRPRPRPRLLAEALEDRSLPTALGSPWPDATSLTVSFVPDGTMNGNTPSTLFKTMNAIAPTAVWEGEILRAIQTWAASSNINVGLVPDDGAPFGTPGDVEGDARFGDIRIGAVPLSLGTAATTSPFDWSLGTWSGDMVFNSSQPFAINPAPSLLSLPLLTSEDLYTVALHEAGHVFGLPDTTDQSSVEYQNYTGIWTAPSAGDIAAVQASYGARPADPYESTSFAAATAIGTVGAVPVITASLQNNADVDTYSVTNGAGTNFAVQVKTSGLSLLVPSLSVYDASGNLVASAEATDPTNGDLTVTVAGAVPNAQYFVQVTGATSTVFGVGKYELAVSPAPVSLARTDVFVPDAGTNNTLATATVLTHAQPGVAFAGNDYAYNGVLQSSTDTDFYQVPTPVVATGTDQAMIVRIRAMATGQAVPALTVTDAAGHAVQTVVIASDSQTLTLQVLNPTPGASYDVKVANPAGGGNAQGDYRLTVNFQTASGSVLQKFQSGQVGGGGLLGLLGAVLPPLGVLVVTDSRLFNFALFAAPATGTTAAPLTATFRNILGQVVLQLTETPSQVATGSVYLAPGVYTVTITKSGSVPLTNFWLYGGVESFPMGTYPTLTGTTITAGNSPTASAPPSSPTTTTTTKVAAPPSLSSGYVYTF